MAKTLIAYYSRKGENYASGTIKNLKIGNTEVAAQMLKDITGGDLFEIDTVNEYPANYNETTKVAKEEISTKARPELTAQVNNMEEYNTIILGYPNWWGTMPMAVFTFLESYDFSGKTIIPFCTHEGSGLGNSEKDIANICQNATLLKGLAIHGTNVANAKNDIEKGMESRLK